MLTLLDRIAKKNSVKHHTGVSLSSPPVFRKVSSRESHGILDNIEVLLVLKRAQQLRDLHPTGTNDLMFGAVAG